MAELVKTAGNLLGFHHLCGLDYPYNRELKSFLGKPVKKTPENASSRRAEERTAQSEKKLHNLDDLSAMIAECRACPLSRTTAERIPAEGYKNRPLGLFIVCDPPLAGTTPPIAPIQGEARKLLARMLAAIDLTIEEVFLTSPVKCPSTESNFSVKNKIKACLSWLVKEVDLLAPGIILTLGPLSAKLLLDTEKQLFTLRGRFHKWQDTPLVPSYHPDILLKHEELKKASWEDLKLVKKMLSP